MQRDGDRPRELRWYHVGGMLFGDWGTSRLYVLGLCFFHAGHASIWFVGAMSILLLAVGWAYQVICRLHPDGGGVYSSARERSPLLGMIGGLLLCADYVVTAAISALDAFHYLNLPHEAWWAAGAILLVGLLNTFGPRHSGRAALVIAIATVAITVTIVLCAAPAMAEIRVTRPRGWFGDWWMQFTAIILAISGVEAVANMTGIMVRPVERTSRRAILPVVTEIVVLNLLLTLAMQAMPLGVLGGGDPAQSQSAHRDDMLRVMAEHYVGHGFAIAASLVFAALLLSAANTAVVDLVSIQFMMSRDRELPPRLGRLNRFGVPLTPLWLATIVPAVVVIATDDVAHLADLYAIGVVGAVAVNLTTTSTNPRARMGHWERRCMLGLAILMMAIWLTIAWEKPWAVAFAAAFVGSGLGVRWLVHRQSALPVPFPAESFGPPAARKVTGDAVPDRTAIVRTAVASSAGVKSPVEAGRWPQGGAIPRLMMSTRGNPKLVQFAIEEAAIRGAELMALFVREVAVRPMGNSLRPDAIPDPEADRMFAMVQETAEAAGVRVIPLYAVSADAAETILDFAVTHGVDALILGASQRGPLWKAMKGDVLQEVGRYLPESIRLLIMA